MESMTVTWAAVIPVAWNIIGRDTNLNNWAIYFSFNGLTGQMEIAIKSLHFIHSALDFLSKRPPLPLLVGDEVKIVDFQWEKGMARTPLHWTDVHLAGGLPPSSWHPPGL